MGLHDVVFRPVEPPRLLQDAVRNADLADIVERSRLIEQVDKFFVESRRFRFAPVECLGKHADIMLRATDMVARLVVACFGK
ncbi:hypothetical protein D3C87_1815970 [compost metagenome]